MTKFTVTWGDLEVMRERAEKAEALVCTLQIAANDRAVTHRVELAKLEAEIARLTAAHDHQYGVAGTMLREAERVGRENEKLIKQIAAIRETFHSDTSLWAYLDLKEKYDALLAEAEDHGDDMAQVLARAERAEARVQSMLHDDWGSLRREVETLRALLTMSSLGKLAAEVSVGYRWRELPDMKWVSAFAKALQERAGRVDE
jgi:hypothetical protein